MFKIKKARSHAVKCIWYEQYHAKLSSVCTCSASKQRSASKRLRKALWDAIEGRRPEWRGADTHIEGEWVIITHRSSGCVARIPIAALEE